MAYEITTLVVINSPDDYLSWPAARKVMRWKAVIRWHDYIADLYGKGKVRWCWGSHQLISKFTASPIVSTHVAIYQCDGISEFTKLLEQDPMREYSAYMTVPLRSLEHDWLEETGDTATIVPLPNDATARVSQELTRGLYRTAPNFAPKAGEAFLAPANPPMPPDAVASADDPLSYLLVGHGPQAGITMNDAQRQIYAEKVKWWHGYNRSLIEQGTVTHGWANGVLCHPREPKANTKGAVAVITVRTPDELDIAVNANPLGEESDLISVVLRPLGDQKQSDLERLSLAENELKAEMALGQP
jgi:hypothetical protein